MASTITSPSTDPGSEPGSAAVRLEGVTKRFGAVLAVDSVSLAINPGQVHAWVGQNGAGKSTCLGMIAGRISPSAGNVTVGGVQYPPTVTPQTARRAGVTAIYQELSIIPAMSALENAFINRMNARGGVVDFRPLRAEFAEICERLAVRMDPDVPAGRLSLADQQMLEIMRALLLRTRVLLLDEPTAALAPNERETLFSVMRDLRAGGVCLVFVSHNLDEVLANADVVSVFRDGRLIETRDADAWTNETLVQSMLGTELQTLRRVSVAKRAGEQAATALRVEGLSVGRVADVSLHVQRGEVVGVGGLVGSGRSTLVRAIAGVQPATTGRMWVQDEEVRLPRSPREAWVRRIALIPEDRKVAGVIPAMSARENIVVGDMAATGAWGIVRRGALRRRTDQLAVQYGLPSRFLDRPSGQLSGGNQQKLLFARWGFRPPHLLLADEATRGIDVGAKGQILETLRKLAFDGLGVLFVSSELEEVAAISDRVYVLSAGRLVAELPGGADLTENDILRYAFGLGAASHA